MKTDTSALEVLLFIHVSGPTWNFTREKLISTSTNQQQLNIMKFKKNNINYIFSWTKTHTKNQWKQKNRILLEEQASCLAHINECITRINKQWEIIGLEQLTSCRPTQVTYNSIWHAINTRYINSTKETSCITSEKTTIIPQKYNNASEKETNQK